ncbi:hypothetical protein K443DRAFT_92166 [Laccaria amethystina LaAM-08-1]|uniref:Zn(2)-C6 fungal-type domain-containing protein n=1 Tax=Laccaria amethystina LaAM-08-1 TaxID=1095629 RepID=A0A0C9YA95_9AGAR|nr:hypothetical protein K443DRAFT_92166 [Laccaria amethystina LaAM-08-1]
MSNFYGPSYQDSPQPTLSPAARDENRRTFLDLNQPLTSMGRKQPSHIQTPARNVYSPQPTFSPTYDPATQNFQVASRHEFDRSEDIHFPHDEGDRFRSQQPAGGIAYYVADTFCDTPLARGNLDFSPPVSTPSTCGSFQYYNSEEGSVEWQGAYHIPCEEDQFAAYDAFGQPPCNAVNLPPYHSQHPPISPTQHSSYSELSAHVLYLSELSRAESKVSNAPITPSKPNIQQTSTKTKRKERPSSDSDLDMDFKPHFPSSSRRRSAPAPVKQKVASVPRSQSTAPPPRPHTPKKAGAQKRLSLACLFCRERKIACGRPSEEEPDQTCAQCLRRDLTCEYPKESRRGQHKRGPKPTAKAGHR